MEELLAQGKRRGEHVFGHRLGEAADVAGDDRRLGDATEVDVIDSGGGELDEAPAWMLRPPRAEFPLRIEREEIFGRFERLAPLRFGEFGEEDDPAEPAEPRLHGFTHGGVEGDENGGRVGRHGVTPEMRSRGDAIAPHYQSISLSAIPSMVRGARGGSRGMVRRSLR